MNIFGAMAFHLLAFVALTIIQCAATDEGSAFFNTPTTSSTYARVKYVNQANLTRRFGSSRDPTIQYISFDELYNKYNKGGSLSKTSVQEPLTTSERPVEADDKMDSQWPDSAPNLRNGWTVERQRPEETAVSPSKTRVKTASSAFNKGIDQVYAYSNAYQSGQFSKESVSSTAKPVFVQVAPGEYAHAIEDDQQDHQGAGSDLKTNAVVVENSWTEEEHDDDEELQTDAFIDDRSDVQATSVKPKNFAKADGVQSAWRPFAGPSTVSPQPEMVRKTTPADIDQTTAVNGSEDVLFYSEAKKAASRRPAPANPNVHRPAPPMPPGVNPFPQQQFLVRPNGDSGQLWVIPNTADNEVTHGSSQPTPRPFSGRPDDRVKFAPPNFQHSNQHPIVLPPPPSMAGSSQPPRDQFQPPRNQFQPPRDQFQPPRDQFQPPRDQFQPPRDRFQQGQPQWSSINPHFPLSRPNGAPSGPVSVAPQLLNPSGQVQPRPQEAERRPVHIPLPIPRPTGPLGSSPDNPLPGPPIALPGIPAFNMHNPNVPDRNQRFPPGPPQHFPTVHLPDRSDGPQGQDNFVRGPPQQPPFTQQPTFTQQQPFSPNSQQPPFNPNGPLPPFNGPHPNFNRPPPPPPQGTTPTSMLKSFFSRFFPFARSMDLDAIPMLDIDQLTNNGTNLTLLADAPPEVVAHLLSLSSNSTSTENSSEEDSATTVARDTTEESS